MTDQPALRMGYLVSKYPAVSHTFILREVAALRARGVLIEVASINGAGTTEAMTEEERKEADRTFYVKRVAAGGALKAGIGLLIKRPLRFVSGLRAALKLGGMDPRQSLLCLFYLAEAIILARWMERRTLTHLHVHFATPAATVALLLPQIAPITFSMMVHGPDEFYDVSSYYLPEKIVGARFIVCISYFAQSQLMKLSAGELWGKFEIARLGVDTDHFAPRLFRASPETFEILCVGRLVPTKGQRILIQACALLAQQGRPFNMRFVGDGPDRQALQQLVQELNLTNHIRFEGSINQDRIQEFYKKADIFALASFAEGIPVVLMEAMAMEIPCVSTGINGIPELIESGKNGVLVAPSDVEGFAAVLAKLMDDAEMRKSLGKAGRVRVLRNYEISASADRLLAVFQQRLGRGQQ
jgi:glycosyltransferase involved in cell wall biosynthesis